MKQVGANSIRRICPGTRPLTTTLLLDPKMDFQIPAPRTRKVVLAVCSNDSIEPSSKGSRTKDCSRRRCRRRSVRSCSSSSSGSNGSKGSKGDGGDRGRGSSSTFLRLNMHAAKKTAEDRPEASPAKLARVNSPIQMGLRHFGIRSGLLCDRTDRTSDKQKP